VIKGRGSKKGRGDSKQRKIVSRSKLFGPFRIRDEDPVFVYGIICIHYTSVAFLLFEPVSFAIDLGASVVFSPSFLSLSLYTYILFFFLPCPF
jgi:hypothetical protein